MDDATHTAAMGVIMREVSPPIRKRERRKSVYGHIPDFPVGSTFETRIECSRKGVHNPPIGGIHGSGTFGAYSIVLSGRYEDDVDDGETFVYTGEGGRTPKDDRQGQSAYSFDGPQSSDQNWESTGNKALRVSAMTKKPVRVIRGHKGNSTYAPSEGFRYDGLYVVEEAELKTGKTGFMTCQFPFRRLPGQPPLPKRSDFGLPAKVPAAPVARPDAHVSTPRALIRSHRPAHPYATLGRLIKRREWADSDSDFSDHEFDLRPQYVLTARSRIKLAGSRLSSAKEECLYVEGDSRQPTVQAPLSSAKLEKGPPLASDVDMVDVSPDPHGKPEMDEEHVATYVQIAHDNPEVDLSEEEY